MTKAEFIDTVHAAAGGDLTKKQVGELVEATFESLGEAIKSGERFSFPGFGTFTVKTRAARIGRNPQNKQPINIPESKTVSFKPAAKFKDSL
jgi:DNA-binding protein HU-beta